MQAKIKSRMMLSFSMALFFIAGCSNGYAETPPPKATVETYSDKDYKETLKKYVGDDGNVYYKGFQKDRKGLDAYNDRLAKFKPSVYEKWSEKQKMALWINAYNSLTLKSILDNYPIKSSWTKSLRYPKNSIRQIDGVWKTIKHPVMGKNYTLNDIENKILRPEFKNPLVHMAIVCASRGCPYLSNEPFTGDKLDAQLKKQAKKFLGTSSKFKIDKKNKKVYISKIFSWFGSDFVEKYSPANGFPGQNKTDKAVLNFIAGHLNKAEAKYLKDTELSLKYLDYSWELNESKTEIPQKEEKKKKVEKQ